MSMIILTIYGKKPMSFQTSINTFHVSFLFIHQHFLFLFITFEVKTREKCHSQNFSEDFPSHDFPFINKPFLSKPIPTCYITMLTEFAITKFISFLTHLGGRGVFGAKYYPYILKGLTDLMTLQSSKNRLLFHYFAHLYNYRNE